MNQRKQRKELEKEGISVEVIDLRTVAPFDIDTILESVKKTGYAVVVQEAQRLTGLANHIMAEIAENAMYDLEAPIGRVAPPTVTSHSVHLSQFGYQMRKILKPELNALSTDKITGKEEILWHINLNYRT